MLWTWDHKSLRDGNHWDWEVQQYGTSHWLWYHQCYNNLWSWDAGMYCVCVCVHVCVRVAVYKYILCVNLCEPRCILCVYYTLYTCMCICLCTAYNFVGVYVPTLLHDSLYVHLNEHWWHNYIIMMLYTAGSTVTVIRKVDYLTAHDHYQWLLTGLQW